MKKEKSEYNKDLIIELEKICSKLDYLLQEGVILTMIEKETILKLVGNMKQIINDFEIH